MTDRELMRQVLEDICGARLCEVNSMSSRGEAERLLSKAADALRERLAQPEQESECNKLAAWMMQRSYATGHGDTVDDLLKELEWQVAEREREACAKIAEYKLDSKGLTAPNSPKEWWNIACQNIRDAIRARGRT